MNFLILFVVFCSTFDTVKGKSQESSDVDIQTIVNDIASLQESLSEKDKTKVDQFSVITNIVRDQETRIKRLEKTARYAKTLESIVKQLSKRVTDLEKRENNFVKLLGKVKRQEKYISDLHKIYYKTPNIQIQQFGKQNMKMNESNGNGRQTFGSNKKQARLLNETQIEQKSFLKTKTPNNEGSTPFYSRKARLLVPSTSPPPNSDVIAFYAYISQTIPAPSKGHTLIFDTEITNVGNAYHKSTGVFSVPKSGWYVFSWSIRYFRAERATEIIVNQAVMGTLYTRQVEDGDDQTASQTVVLHVNQGDDVFIRSHQTFHFSGNVLSDGWGRSTYAGWKLG